ncbi:MAG: phosphate acyltransferase PlsX [Ginsengibacter sp.]
MKIALDMMGGDFAPIEAVKGIGLFLSKPQPDVGLILIGDEKKIKLLLSENGVNDENIPVVHADQEIEMHEHPIKALKEKKQSSIALGFQLLATGKAHAFISAGNTGAMMVGALSSIKAIEGVLRPAIGAYIPKENGKLALLLDVGLNADCKPENLSQFAVLGTLFAKHILNIPNPRVGLINLGEEEGKGNLLTQATYLLLKENRRINFIGNVEGRDILPDKADIYVCEGFTGNVILKFAESIYDIVQSRNIIDEHFNRFNFEIYGGVPILGVNKTVIIGHGISHAQAFANMIELAKKMHDEELIDKIRNAFVMEE